MPSREPLTPRQLLRAWAIVFIACNVVAVYFMAITDAQGQYEYFKRIALGLTLVSCVIVINGYLSIRRAWLEQQQSDMKDGILPVILLVALGWGIWSLAHLGTALPSQ